VKEILSRLLGKTQVQEAEKHKQKKGPASPGDNAGKNTAMFTHRMQAQGGSRCYVVLVGSWAHTPYPMDLFLQGEFDKLYKENDIFRADHFVGAYDNLGIAREAAHPYGPESHPDGRYILEIPCSSKEFPALFKAGISKAVQRVYNISKLGQAGYKGDQNSYFDQEAVTKASTNASQLEAPTGS